MRKYFWWLLGFFSFALLFYADGLRHFFYQDDLFHLHISQAKDLSDVVAFFNPINEFGYQIYRPLGTQVVFWLMQSFFGLNHTAFYLLILLLLSSNTTLLYGLLRSKISRLPALLLSLFYLTHHQNIGVVYFLSVVQLSLALFFTLISLHMIRRQKAGWQWQTYLLYVATLLSQEIALLNAVILPILLYMQSPKLLRAQWRYVVALLGTMVAYLGMRFYFINHQIFSDNTHYAISLYPADLINNLVWYGLWFLSVPEYVINFVGSGLRPLPPLFGQYARETWLTLSIVATSVVVIFNLVYRYFFAKFWHHCWYLACFVLSLAPVLVFPWHKYVYHLPIASVFMVLWLTSFIAYAESSPVKNPVSPTKHWQKHIIPLILVVLLVGSISTNLIDRRHSYNYQRGALSAKMLQQIDWNRLQSGNHLILVKNDPNFQVFSSDWGNTSSQAKIILKDDLFFKLVSGNPNLVVNYEDDLDPSAAQTLVEQENTYVVTALSR